MDQNTAEIILNDTFNHPFNEEKFSNFSLNLLKNFNLSQIDNWQKNEPPKAFKVLQEIKISDISVNSIYKRQWIN